eukprot:6182941-Pleurochrysis_carterae.AAC.1
MSELAPSSSSPGCTANGHLRANSRRTHIITACDASSKSSRPLPVVGTPERGKWNCLGHPGWHLTCRDEAAFRLAHDQPGHGQHS